MGAVLADDLGGGATPAQFTRPNSVPSSRGGHGALAVGFLGDVAMHVALTQFLGQGFARLVLQVGDHHLGAVGHQHAYGAGAQAGCAAGNDEYLVRDFHVSTTWFKRKKAALRAPDAFGPRLDDLRQACAEGLMAERAPFSP